MYSSVVLYTSGIDSIITLEYIRRLIDANTQPVYFNIKSRYSSNECEYIKNNEPNAIIDDSIYLGDIERNDAFIPNRNITLAVMAVSRFSKRVYIGGSLSDRVSDNTKECFDELSSFLTKIDDKEVVKITAPFWNNSKEEMAKWFADNVKSGAEKLFVNSFSCFNPAEDKLIFSYRFKLSAKEFNKSKPSKVKTNHCMRCKACFRRNQILYSIGYLLPFYNKKIIESYQKEFESTIQKTHRSKYTLKYIAELNKAVDLF